jgi:hypothetical protein
LTEEETAMFRCESCGSGYSMRAASSWEACPRCLARDKITVPLTFELGWRSGEAGRRSEQSDRPLPLKRLPLDRRAADEPAEIDAA